MKATRSWLVIGGSAFLAVALGATAFVLLRPGQSGTNTAPEPASRRARQATPLTFLEVVHDGALAPGWQDWGWGPHELGKGPARVGFGSYGGIILWHEQLPSRFGGFSFRYKAPPKFGDFLGVSLRHASTDDAEFPVVPVKSEHIVELPDGFREVLIDWTDLNPRGKPFDRVMIAAKSSVPADFVLLDKIGFTKERPSTSAARTSASGARRNAALAIDCRAPASPINPLIYGFTMSSWDTHGTAQRIGGNPLSRLNWDEGDLWNTGADWFFENHKQATTLTKWIEDGVERDRKTALVVPTIGWVAKDGSSSGFPRAKFGAQRAHDPHRPEAGDGHRPDGTPIAPGLPTETSIAAPPELIGRWISRLVERDKTRGRRSVDMYILDNEPSLWNVTHRDVHPEPLSYDELLDRTLRYGAAIRSADPGGLIAGPAEWGWPGYFDSAKDRDEKRLVKRDRLAHGNVDLVPWYLRKLREHEESTGVRVLDFLDLHYYPQAEGIFSPGKARTDPEGAALRIRSTRSLWDPTYEDESWIKDEVALIPRMKRWVAENYPGRSTVIGEWNFGAEDHISGALATLEALGRFGQHGLDAAFFWGELTPKMKAFWAFRAFRNFDGKGGRFLDLGLKTREAELVSLFASRDASSTRLVAVVANLDANASVAAKIELQGCREVSAVRSFTYGPESAELTANASTAPSRELLAELPPSTFRVIELSLAPAKAP